MVNRICCLIIVLVAFFSALPAIAEPTAQTGHAELQLLVEESAIKPGEPFWAAIDFTLADGWHIYWQNPGDSGLEAQLGWQLPEGFEAGPIHWPPPEAIHYEGLVNYGYEGRVGLLVPITAPQTLPDKPLELAVDVEFLICEKVCIPEAATLSTTLNPGHADDTALSRIAALQADLPQPFEGRAEYDINQEKVYFAFDLAENDLDLRRIYHAWFYPIDDQTISNASKQAWRLDQSVLVLSVDREGNQTPKPFQGVLEVATTDGLRAHFHVSAAFSPASGELPTDILETDPAGDKVTDTPALLTSDMTLWLALISAFLGGIILNIMPCVLPVLSLKALSIAKKSGASPGVLRIEGLAYTAGILISFLIVAGVLIALQQAGHEIGWGFQLQSVGFVSALIYLLFLIGLNLSGVYELPSGITGSANGLSGLSARSGPSGSFFTGVLATIVATPCTAPFMATAIGFALTQSPLIALLIFAALGLGLAFPFVLMTFIPGAARLLPKPGNWMIRFKQFLAFPIYATIIWLLWVLTQQAGPMGLLHTLAAMLLIAFVLWLLPQCRTRLSQIIFVLIGALGILWLTDTESNSPETRAAMQEASEPFSQSTLDRYLAEQRPVFVNATAAWCITCKVNERVALRDEAVLSAMKERNIAYLIADWTNRNDAIARYLQSFDRSGVPLYVWYEPGQDPVVLPQLLTPATVLDHLNQPKGDDS